jgi:hypothetical protein
VGVAADLGSSEPLGPEGLEMGVDVLVEDDALPMLERLDRIRVADRVREPARASNDVPQSRARRT